MIVDRAASKRTRRNSPGSLAVLLPGLREPVPAPESEEPKGNLLEEQLLLRGAAYLTRGGLCPASVSSGVLGLYLARSGPSHLAPPFTKLPPTVSLEAGREQKEHFTIKQGLCERPVAWKRLAPGGEL